MLCSKLSQSSMGPDIKGKNVYGKFPIPSHKLASLRSASKKKTTADLPGGRVCIGFSSSNDFLTVFYLDTRWGAP